MFITGPTEAHPAALPRCDACGYDLSGLARPPAAAAVVRCPECGEVHDAARIRSRPPLPPLLRVIAGLLLPSLAWVGAMLAAATIDAAAVAVAALYGWLLAATITVAHAVLWTTEHHIPRRQRWKAGAIIWTGIAIAVVPLLLGLIGLGALASV